ncbi:MAG TPA: amino acid adenylation domain-containing protein, partial [Thermoanaerobaculia bacterium]|nr:amino acid adenylation domain-containing protein [Thermoanaerobaculia bacterium]
PQAAQEDGSAVFPLSFAQQRLWFVDQWQPRNPAYNIPLAIRAEGRLSREALRSSFDEIVRRQESLRTGFRVQGDQPVQVVRPAEPLPVPEVDLAALPEEVRTAEARRLAEESSLTPFDLGRERLLRVTLLRLGADDHAVLICMHHIVSDGWSISILVQEFVALYTAQVEGRPAPLPPLEVQYPDFAVWQREWLRTEALEAQLDYWRRALAGIPEAIELPLSHPRPAVRTARGRRAYYVFPGELMAPLKTLAQQEGATLFMVLLAAFQTLLHRYSGERDIVVGTPVAGRNRAELERVIGFFVNNLVLRGDLSGDPTFRELAGRVRESTVGAQSHADVPFERLVEELRPERDLSRPPLYQVVFTMQNTPDNTVELPDLSLETLAFDPGTAKNDLLLSVAEGQAGWAGGYLEYSLDLFDAAAANRILGHFRALLQGIGEDPERALSALPLLAEAERWQLLGEWNDTAAELPAGSFRQLWEGRVERWADLPAVVSAVTGESLTYRELDRRANFLAEYLRMLGVGPEVLVGVLMERSVEVVVAMLAVWKAGGVYVPLDPSYPEERLAAMLEDTSLAIVLTQEELAARLPWSAGFVVAVDTEWDRISLGSGEPFGDSLQTGAEPENLAYVIFTSGSTGRPKGVMIQYGGFNVLGLAQERQFGPGGGERLLLFAPLAFDTAIFDWMLALWRGNTLYLAGPEELLPGPALVRLLEREGITSLTMTPSALSAMPIEELPALRRLWVAGEACTPELVARWRTPERAFYNGYGPTEITIWATTETCDDSGRVPPIGRPAANKRTYLLDERSQPVPVGGVAELCVGGAGLARGYLHRPDLTAERFVPDPFSAEPGARLYRTGDLVRQAADGKLLFVGRNDHQVKIRGFRIELGEIEAVLGRHPAVREAAVIVRGENGDKRLAAYWVPRDGSEPAADELRAYLRERLPDFMVPATFTALAALPLTPNDKLDRRVLATIDPAAAQSAQEFLAPRNPIEDLLSLILAEVLSLERVGVRDGFFDLGGHSLLATQVLSRVREAFGVEVALASFFEQPTVEGLAARIQGGTVATGAPLEACPRQADDPLSFAQQRLWFLQQLDR